MSWTEIGCLASPARVCVDGRGMVAVGPDGWSIDWWIGAEDRWHHPSTETSVRQQLVELTPVVETAMRIPGGDAVQRVYARADADLGAVAVIEVENRSPAPLSLAFVVRPLAMTGPAPITSIRLVGCQVDVDGLPGLVLPAPPSRVASATPVGGDLVAAVPNAPVHRGSGALVRDEGGRAQAAFVLPVAHGAALRVLLPLAAAGDRPVRTSSRSPSGAAGPGADAVVRSWHTLADRGLRVTLPPGRVADAFGAARSRLLLAGEDLDLRPGEVSEVLAAQERVGMHTAAIEVLRQAVDRQRHDGRITGSTGDDITAGVLAGLGDHLRMSGDGASLRSLAPAVALAAGWIRRAARRRPRAVPIGGEGAAAVVALARARALRDAAALLVALGEDVGAATVATWAVALRDGARLAVERAGAGADAARMEACWPFGLDPAPPADVRARARRAGTAAASVLAAAIVDAMAGDRAAQGGLEEALDAASGTWTWPRPGGMGHDHGADARLCTLVRTMLVAETPGGLALCPVLPEAWRGQPVEVHAAPTACGLLSFALRWHGDRPALLWELERRGAVAVELRVPGLDPGWSSVEASGEALLAPSP